MSTSTTLESAAQDRKSRLAQLRSLKRKQAPTSEDEDADTGRSQNNGSSEIQEPPSAPFVTETYLSGRNYDVESRNAKLGFESAPNEGALTLEAQAKSIADSTKQQAEEEEKADKPLDLFKLQPKKPNWDLKRDLGRKLEVLNIRTDNAIARLVQERIKNAQKSASGQGSGVDGGVELVEAMHQREREEAEDERREREEDAL